MHVLHLLPEYLGFESRNPFAAELQFLENGKQEVRGRVTRALKKRVHSSADSHFTRVIHFTLHTNKLLLGFSSTGSWRNVLHEKFAVRGD